MDEQTVLAEVSNINNTTWGKREKYEAIKRICVKVTDTNLKTKIIEACPFLDVNQERNLLAKPSDIAKINGGGFNRNKHSYYDDDNIIEANSGIYLGHGEWDTLSGQDEGFDPNY